MIPIYLLALSACNVITPTRIIIFGDSITRHPVASVLGWDIHAGMAASSEATDWAHLLKAHYGAVLKIPIIQSVSDPPNTWECPGGFTTCPDVITTWDSFAPDLVIIQAAEHFGAAMPWGTVPTWLNTVIDWAEGHGADVLCIARWETSQRPLTAGSAGSQSDAIQRAVCGNDRYVDIDGIAYDADTRGYPADADPDVQWHPNDEGHRRIYERIVEVLNGNHY
jgi:hypothetical protein